MCPFMVIFKNRSAAINGLTLAPVAARKSGSHATLCWREADSNSWSRWLGASGSLPRISLDLGLFLLYLLGLIFERAGRPFGFGRLRLTLLLEPSRLPAINS